VADARLAYLQGNYDDAERLFAASDQPDDYWIGRCRLMRHDIEGATIAFARGAHSGNESIRKLCLNALSFTAKDTAQGNSARSTIAKTTPGRIGTSFNNTTVTAFLPSSPAPKAGLRVADEIVEIKGYPTRGLGSIDTTLLSRGSLSDAAVLTVKRGKGALKRISIRRIADKSPPLDAASGGSIHISRVAYGSDKTQPDAEQADKEAQAIAVSSDDSNGWLKRADVYRNYNLRDKLNANLEMAIKIETSQIQRTPFIGANWSRRGDTLFKLERYADAIADFTTAEKLGAGKDLGTLYIERAEAYDRTGSFEEESRDLQHYLTLYPDDREAEFKLFKLKKSHLAESKPNATH
jgi:hypothetical protein